MKSREYLTKIRTAAGLSRAVLRKITVCGSEATFFLETDAKYSPADVAFAREVTQSFVPKGMRAEVSVKKVSLHAERLKAAVLGYMKERFPAAAAFLSEADVEVSLGEGGGSFVLYLTEEEQKSLPIAGLLNDLSLLLSKNFCGSFLGTYQTREREREEEIAPPAPPPEEFLAPIRTFEIEDYVPLDGAEPTVAVYCGDLTGEMQSVTVCGAIAELEERLTQKGKPYFRISVSDGSGRAGGLYFPRKISLEKARKLKIGDFVCLTGGMELYKNSYSFRVNRVDYGNPPKGFTPKERASRPAPACFKAVFPEPFEDFRQEELISDGKPLPEEVLSRPFVVFDLETTGLNNTPVGGTMDRIIEIGAVKIERGLVSEKFSTFVSCPVKLSKEITALTGIDDTMLAGAPGIEDVIADFFKFCEGAVLVGHNVQFDYRFVRFYGGKEGFFFCNKQADTLAMAQEMLFLKNYKLNTVADYFGFSFRHHRAFDDALVTAKIFLELARRKGEAFRV